MGNIPVGLVRAVSAALLSQMENNWSNYQLICTFGRLKQSSVNICSTGLSMRVCIRQAKRLVIFEGASRHVMPPSVELVVLGEETNFRLDLA